MLYQLKGKVSILQHCYERYPKAETVGLSVLKRCTGPEVCEGHLITLEVCEIVEIKDIHNQDEVMAASLRAYEGQGLEPCWEEGPDITPYSTDKKKRERRLIFLRTFPWRLQDDTFLDDFVEFLHTHGITEIE
jgi:hypothetical protein